MQFIAIQNSSKLFSKPAALRKSSIKEFEFCSIRATNELGTFLIYTVIMSSQFHLTAAGNKLSNRIQGLNTLSSSNNP